MFYDTYYKWSKNPIHFEKNEEAEVETFITRLIMSLYRDMKLGIIIDEKSKYRYRQSLRVFDKDLTTLQNFTRVQGNEVNFS